jgi:ubiquinone/menaquinone biosynthesis C-methylase UbiE
MTSETMADVTTVVREKYGEAAKKVLSGTGAASCGPSGDGCGCGCDPVSRDLYDAAEIAGVPGDAVLASLGCGNPTALAELKPGEVVLDLGSGGGIDVLLSARRVGPTGKAYGLDTTDEMLALAERNKAKSGLTNVEFLRGEIERIPLPDASVDVIISNCVINLSGDKDRVLAEAFRVLKPGGRFAVSDVVIRGTLPPAVRRSMEAWVGCVAGALEMDEYRAKLAAAGFAGADLEVTREYSADDAKAFLRAEGVDAASLAAEAHGAVVSAFVRATKPAAATGCCGPACCQ